MTPDLLQFWNDRAQLKDKAGSDDLIAKSIEIEALAKFFKDGIEVLEFGCGNGITAIEMSRRFNIAVDAYDFSLEMVNEARKLSAASGYDKSIKFSTGDINNPPITDKKYDLIFTERMIINLANWDEQQKAIKTLCSYLKPQGKLLLLENSATGLQKINSLRAMTGLNPITPPWHNIYLEDEKIQELKIDGCTLSEVIPYSATYYFLSRVVNAWLANQEGHPPQYDASVNKLALSLPAIGDHAQGKIWIFERS